jgi:hypothetical protein
MIEDAQQLDKLMKLPIEERLRLGRLPIESACGSAESSSHSPKADDNGATSNPLLALAGRYSGGPGDSAGRAEEILDSESWRKNV